MEDVVTTGGSVWEVIGVQKARAELADVFW